MGFKKYDGSAWQPINPKQLKGIPYTGTLPATITGTKAGYLHGYKIYGNTEQTGTPTPENPIYPSECGERTENLFSGEFSQFDNVGGTGNVYAYFYIPEDFTLTVIAKDTHTIPSNVYLGITKDGGQYTGGFTWAILQRETVTKGDIITVKSSTNGYHYVSMYTKFASTLNWILEHYYVMLNSGSTALPYEPYGYKLPLTSSGQNVDIYLGESQTTRQIKKLVLTGQETINGMSNANDGAKAVSYTYSALGMTDIINNERGMYAIPYPIYLSSHFKEKTSGYSSWLNINAGEIGANSVQSNTVNRYLIFGTSEQTQADFKAYLAAQYANGTPVTVWYVLATEKTGTLNEPLRKIGNYADTIDSTQTTTQIPTTANSTTISWAGSGLAPSEFDSVQEWVDTPTYTRVNGEWVAE